MNQPRKVSGLVSKDVPHPLKTTGRCPSNVGRLSRPPRLLRVSSLLTLGFIQMMGSCPTVEKPNAALGHEFDPVKDETNSNPALLPSLHALQKATHLLPPCPSSMLSSISSSSTCSRHGFIPSFFTSSAKETSSISGTVLRPGIKVSRRFPDGSLRQKKDDYKNPKATFSAPDWPAFRPNTLLGAWAEPCWKQLDSSSRGFQIFPANIVDQSCLVDDESTNDASQVFFHSP